MSPAIERGFIDEQQLERQLAKQMGCMTGFFHIFDRQHILTGKRIYSTPRLSSSPGAGCTSPSDRSEASCVSALIKDGHPSSLIEPCSSTPYCMPEEVLTRPSLPLRLPVFDFKDGLKPWKLREAHRLSLDSQAVVDAKGKLRPREVRTRVSVPPGKTSDASNSVEIERQRRSPSVVARLMGLEALPDGGGGGGGGVELNHAELRRSASESRVPRDPSYYRLVDAASFEKTSLPPKSKPISAEEYVRCSNVADLKLMTDPKRDPPPPRATALPPLQRKSYFDAEDFFPEPKRSASLCGDFEKRLRWRGIEGPSRDLETLKQILEALQLKGLLHSKTSDHLTNGRRNLIYDNDSMLSGNSPIVVMKPASKRTRRPISEPSPPPSRSSPSHRSSPIVPEYLPPALRDRSVDRNFSRGNDMRSRASPRSPESPSSRRRPSNRPVPQQTPEPQRRVSAVNSPRTSPKMAGQDPVAVRSPRVRRPVQGVSPRSRIFSHAEDDTANIVSGSSISISSRLDLERPPSEKYVSGRSLLERCDKLLSSIAAFTAGESVTAPDQQPSPVSVLDSSPYLGGEEFSPSPSSAIEHSIDLKDQNRSEYPEEDQSEDSVDVSEEIDDVDYVYVARIVHVSYNRRDDSADDVFAALEERCYASDRSKAARLHRRLLFDTVAEILDRKRHLSPWEAFARARFLSGGAATAPLGKVWAEVARIKEQQLTDDLIDITCGAIWKDMAGLDGEDWGAQPLAEMSDAVLQIERQIFKDLIADAISDLADATVAVSFVNSRPLVSRRKLAF